MKTVVLASTSPRRTQLLSQIGIAHRVMAPDYEEDMTLDLPVSELAMTLALGKARAAVGFTSTNDVIVSGDTFVVLRGEILGKPETPEAAHEMLRKLRGETNHVYTGYAVVDNESGNISNGCVCSSVQMRNYSDDEIAGYVADGEPLDKAGAYAINGKGVLLVERVTDGDISAIVGLPLVPVASALRSFGVPVL